MEPEDEFGEAVVERGDVGRVTLADARDAAGAVYTRLFRGAPNSVDTFGPPAALLDVSQVY